MLKKAALENDCDVEELKFIVNDLGIVNIQGMWPDEVEEVRKEEKRLKLKRQIMKAKGMI